MEMWEDEDWLWAELQKNKAMAPKALTSMGYGGKNSMYMRKSLQFGSEKDSFLVQ